MSPTFPTLLPFVLFAFVASITPGPTNILVLSNSVRYGFKATLPIIFGACTGAALIVLLTGFGIGQSLSQHPLLQSILRWVGVTWLSFLAWQIFWAGVETTTVNKPGTGHQRLGLWGAASLQLINPKTWMMALAVVSVFAGQGEEQIVHVMYLSAVFFLISVPCLGFWAALGFGSSRVLSSPRSKQHFNRCMGVALLGSAWLSVLVVF